MLCCGVKNHFQIFTWEGNLQNETRQQYTSKTTVNKHNTLKLTLSWTMWITKSNSGMKCQEPHSFMRFVRWPMTLSISGKHFIPQLFSMIGKVMWQDILNKRVWITSTWRFCGWNLKQVRIQAKVVLTVIPVCLRVMLLPWNEILSNVTMQWTWPAHQLSH